MYTLPFVATSNCYYESLDCTGNSTIANNVSACCLDFSQSYKDDESDECIQCDLIGK